MAISSALRLASVPVLCSLSCLGQTVTMGLSSATGVPGSPVTLNLTMDGGSSDPAASLEWNIGYSTTDFSSVSVTAGPASLSAGKSVSCNSTAGSITCLAWSQSTTPIQNGVVASVLMTISATTQNTSSQVQLGTGFASDGNGASLMTSLSGGVVTIQQPPGLNGFSCNPTSITPPASSLCTVTLTAGAPSGGATIALTQSPADVNMPASLTIPQGATSGTFTVTGGNVGAPTLVTLTASYLSGNEGFGITINPPPPVLLSVGVIPNTILSGQAGVGTVTLTGPAGTGGVVVSLLSSNPSAASLPTSVTIPQGSTSGIFQVTAGIVSVATPVVVTASYMGANVQANIVIAPLPTALASLSVVPTVIASTQSGIGTVTLTLPAGTGGAVVSLSSSNSIAASVPSTVTVPQGGLTATFQVSAGTESVDTPVVLTASYSGSYATANITISPLPPGLTNLSVSPSVVLGGQPATGTITLSGPAGTGGAVVSLASSTQTVGVPATVTVPPGATSATFSVSTGPVTAASCALVTATLSGVNQTARMIVEAQSPSGSAACFQTIDTVTEGNWRSVYGQYGYTVIGDSSGGSGTVNPSGDRTGIWAQSTSDPRALERASRGGRVAAMWYQPKDVLVDVAFPDHNVRQVAVYFLDWNLKGRSESVELLDASTGAVLDTRTISNFTNGTYLVWNVSGNFHLQIKRVSGVNAVVSGVFFSN